MTRHYGPGHRNPGSVGVVGLTRMDYEKAIASVSEAAHGAFLLLRIRSRRMSEKARLLRDSPGKPGSDRTRRSRRHSARSPGNPPGRERLTIPGGRREVHEAPRPTRCSPTPSGGNPRPVRSRRALPGGYQSQAQGFGSIDDLFSAFFGGGFGASGSGAGCRRRGSEPRSNGDVLDGTTREVEFRCGHELRARHGNGAEPGTPIKTCDRCGGSGELRASPTTPPSARWSGPPCDRCHGDGAGSPRNPVRFCSAGPQAHRQKHRIDIPAGIESGQRIRTSGAGTLVKTAPPGDLMSRFRSPNAREWSATARPDHRGTGRRHGGDDRRHA